MTIEEVIEALKDLIGYLPSEWSCDIYSNTRQTSESFDCACDYCIERNCKYRKAIEITIKILRNMEVKNEDSEKKTKN